jgi:2-methylcitrate dehydratase PrpD
VAERRGVAGQPVDGRAFIDALLVAVDIAATVGLAARSPMRFFRPAMAGALGALGGAARLSAFAPDALERAYGLLLAQLSGTMQAHVEGTPGLALQIAVNARAAVTALDMADAGLTGPRDVFEGAYAYHALVDGDWSADPYATLGQIARISEVSHKPFPTGRAAHAALDALEQLVRAHALTADDISAVVLHAPPLVRRLVGRAASPDMKPSWARLCLPYLVARRLLHGPIGVTDFEPACYTDPALHALAARVRWEPNGVDDPNALEPQTLRVTCRDGRVLERTLDAVLGAPAARLDAAAQRAKFEHCLDHAPQAWTPAQRQHLADTTAAVETLDDIRRLVDACNQNRDTHPTRR